ncbi:histidine phosphatase family protein [Candidatus Woesearchaeota archaeon]|nr:histidine phosphatase family protein [Candidatus Woesearchaeota archaeon]
MKLIIVRHGETNENIKDIMQDKNATLSELGKIQARKVGERLKNEKIDVIYVSNLDRAVESAEEIIKHHPDVDVIYSKELRERDLGAFEGKPIGHLLNHRKNNNLEFHTFRPKGGESPLDAQERVKKFVYGLLKKYHSKTVLLITHGALISLFLLHLKNTQIEIDIFRKHCPDNTGIIILEIDEDKNHKVHLLNCTKHLE